MKIVNLFDIMPDAFTGIDTNKSKKKKRNKKHNISANQLNLLDIMLSFEAKEEYVRNCEEIIEEVKKPLSLLFEASNELLDFKLTKQLKFGGTVDEKIQNNLKAIKVLKNLQQYERYAKGEDQKKLAKYTGWGGLSKAFRSSKYDKELKNVLSEEEYISVSNTVNTAFYTPIEVIRFMYRTLQRMGFDGGHILDPATGTGNFLGVMPEVIRENSKIVAIEKDTISGTIAQQLYQSANVKIQGYEETYLKDDSFDLAITNVPFVDVSPFDKYDKDLNELNLYLHDYYFAKSLKKVREGGIIAFITSSGTMDKTDSKLREYLGSKTEFIGAVRLPYNSFKKFSNVEVMTDIIFLQKTNKPSTKEWVNLKSSDGITFNEYFIDNPSMMIGNVIEISGQFGHKHVLDYNGNLEKALDNLVQAFPQDIYMPLDNDNYRYEDEKLINLANTKMEYMVKPYSYVKYEDNFYQRQGLYLIPIEVRKPELLNDFIILKEKIKEIIEEQLNNCSDETLKLLQKQLNSIYDDFICKFGYISSKGNKKILSDDPEYFLACSIEKEIGTRYIKGAFFTDRTIGTRRKIDKAESIEDALIYCFSEKGMLDFDYIASLLKKDVIEVIDILESKDLIFYDIESDNYVHRDEYLSGNVKKKLKIAKEFVKENIRFEKNVHALEGIQPGYIYDVYYQLGTTWISDEIYNNFINELLHCNTINVKYNKVLGQYAVSRNGYVDATLFRTTYGTDRLNAIQCLRHALNLTNPVIYDEIGDNGIKKRIKNAKDTELARSKVNLLKNEFLSWIDKNIEIKNSLIEYYNEHFNNIVNREYNGSFLNPQVNPTIKLRDHQKAAAARTILSKYNSLLAHCVGAGKTYTMQVAAMEMKRLGMISKPLFVIPNSLVESGQFVTEFLTIYPYANILSASSRDFSKANRRKLINKIATGNWDAIIIGHSSFGMIPMDKEFQEGLIKEQIRKLNLVIYELDTEQDKIAIKQMKKSIEKLEARLLKISDKMEDNGLPTFDKLGIDYIFLDEAHRFKNLGIATKLSGVSGVQTSDAKKAFDLLCKIEWLRRNAHNKCVTFATATPISNSVCEAYTMMLYLIPEVLNDYGVYEFDSWASVYGKIISQLEVDPTGTGFRTKDRFSQFCNVPELITMFREAADVITKDMVKLPVPSLKTGNIINVSVEAPKLVKDYVATLVDRAAAIDAKLVKPYEDNMLLVTMDGRKVATDPRLVGLDVTNDGDTPKLIALCENVYKEYVAGNVDRLTQAIFLNLGTPSGKSFNLYAAIKDKLVEMGIPKDEVKFIHEANNSEKRTALLKAFRNGEIRVLIGSTDKMGEGTNMQDRLVAIHEFDCEWKPALIEQKEGRILRQGNMNKEVSIYRYVTKGTFDVYMWQTCETKARYIDQLMNNKTGARTIEDLGDTILSFAETKALACENPLIMEKFKVDKQIQHLQMLEKAFKEQQMIAFRRMKKLEYDKKSLLLNVNDLKKDVLFANEHHLTDFQILINGENFSDRKVAGEKILQLIDELKISKTQDLLEKPIKIGEYRGFDLTYKLSKDPFDGKLLKILGLRNEKYYSFDFSISPLGIIARIENRVKGLIDTLNSITNSLSLIDNEITIVNDELKKEFLQKSELDNLLLKQSEINSQLDINSSAADTIEEDVAI
ncbi:hypothetical protein U732_128 [Clostridium argentinense CDC 2741]|uniref:Helicase C-terminal domain-containing protein n=2 Tax=Clostridium argentinense TaxID=29341 RepID=A0A0C1QUK5_9CLOT|nr:helicase-related protein [Clostridium argentinense]ARC83141.1 hypothetical protein RSJ17_00375 [Clostridium argentinense]KIE44727.1 hypothetical protein U732_128 [Clostridium argentinense CDC 2741]NFF41619.1 DNA helicase [Clostridium argentinense]NFP52319.1 DNA helicase [Clostridium argentinense]NFP74668.1 DNA helicase [Clostridium argentinense]